MRITASTTPQSVAEKTKSIMRSNVIPNMLLENVGKPNGFASDKMDYLFWLERVCGKQK